MRLNILPLLQRESGISRGDCSDEVLCGAVIVLEKRMTIPGYLRLYLCLVIQPSAPGLILES